MKRRAKFATLGIGVGAAIGVVGFVVPASAAPNGSGSVAPAQVQQAVPAGPASPVWIKSVLNSASKYAKAYQSQSFLQNACPSGMKGGVAEATPGFDGARFD
ncbi:hypothetical protein [Embleya sp. NPDC005575]|uniref:hypothetical protein n=1 Tax=Embleya sp. NPDC005575 TaxID=3156892 RepID=UPI0033AA6147